MDKKAMKDICECDVRDKESLALFRSLMCKWQEVLAGEDRHSIFNQIQDLVWDDAVYRTFNEARRISIENRENGNQLLCTITEVATPQFDQLKYWEMPVINADLRTQLYDFWNIRVEKIYTWSRIDGERLEEKSLILDRTCTVRSRYS